MQNLPANMNALVTSLETATTSVSQQSGSEPFLRLLKSGEWVYGGDDIDVEKSSKWAVNPNSFALGFQAWSTGGELAGEEIALVSEPPVLKSQLDDVGAEWKPIIACQLVCLSGEDAKQAVLFKTSSKGGIKALNDLMKDLVNRIKNPDAKGCYVPVVDLLTDNYKHKTYGRIYTPVLKITEWVEEANVDATEPQVTIEAEPEPEPVVEPKPKRTRRRG
jgi:hypothetical protein